PRWRSRYQSRERVSLTLSIVIRADGGACMGLLNDARVEALLDRLHAQSSAQDAALQQYFAKRMEEGTLDWKGLDADAHRFMSDKLVALDRDKAELCYQLCRALRAKRVIEVGTSFGVSTLYLAAGPAL